MSAGRLNKGGQICNLMEEVSMLNNIEFDPWADGYDKTVGISDEENTYPFAGYK